MTAPSGPGEAISPGIRRAALTGAVLRYLIPVATLPFVPALIPDDVPLLTLLRPGKEVLLLAGGLRSSTGEPALGLVLLAYVPLMVFGVWVFFVVGRAYSDELENGEGPDWLYRVVPRDQLRIAQRVLEKRGPLIAVLGRIAAMPPTIVAAAAGTSRVGATRFLAADLVGALAAFGATVGAGLALGSAYEQAGWWLTIAGLVLLGGLVALFTRWFNREAERHQAEDAA